jgi:hypothetical protein
LVKKQKTPNLQLGGRDEAGKPIHINKLGLRISDDVNILPLKKRKTWDETEGTAHVISSCREEGREVTRNRLKRNVNITGVNG